MTRRVVKPDISNQFDLERDGKTIVAYIDQETGDSYRPEQVCSYKVGMDLWVRETWYYESHMHDLTAGAPDLPNGLYSHRFVFKASSPDYPVNVGVGRHGWRPSIFMPKAAARIWLKVTAVRCERLQEITVEDVISEGLTADNEIRNPDTTTHESIRNWNLGYAKFMFRNLWDPLNAKRGYGWDTNPFVWKISFERCDKPQEVRDGN